MGWFDSGPFQSRRYPKASLVLPPLGQDGVSLRKAGLLWVDVSGRLRASWSRRGVRTYSQQVESQAFEVPQEEGLRAHADQH